MLNKAKEEIEREKLKKNELRQKTFAAKEQRD